MKSDYEKDALIELWKICELMMYHEYCDFNRGLYINAIHLQIREYKMLPLSRK